MRSCLVTRMQDSIIIYLFQNLGTAVIFKDCIWREIKMRSISALLAIIDSQYFSSLLLSKKAEDAFIRCFICV